MKMTRYMLIPLALVAFAACAKVEREEAPATKVTFNVGSYAAQTKAVAVSEFTAFKSKAYLHAQGVDFDNQGNPVSKQDFFGNGETISYTETQAATETTPAKVEWAPSHPYYWPKGEQSYINFVAWFGTDGTNDIDPTVDYAKNTQSGKWAASMTWDFSNGLPVNANVMYADMAWRFKQNNKPATYGSVSGVSEGVPMLFHHALAKLIFKAYAADDYDKDAETNLETWWKAEITGISLTPIHNTGTLAMTNSDPETAAKEIPWTLSTGTGVVDGWSLGQGTTTLTGTATEADPLELDTTVAAIPGMSLSVLPQSVAGMALTIKYAIHTSYDNWDTTYSIENLETTVPMYLATGSAFSNSIDKWRANTIYTYIIKIDPSTKVIIYEPTADAWVGPIEGGLDIE